VLAIKGNKGEFYDDIKTFLDSHLARNFKDIAHDSHHTTEGDHGRIEQRRVWLTSDVSWLIARHPKWRTVKAIAIVESSRELPGKRLSHERRYYISSHKGATAEFIAHAIRSHWYVENKLHWQLDVSFHEEGCRLRSGHAAENIALMNKVALNLLKNEKKAPRSESKANGSKPVGIMIIC
jgi:predicted transposase YbfD/YdcC